MAGLTYSQRELRAAREAAAIRAKETAAAWQAQQEADAKAAAEEQAQREAEEARQQEEQRREQEARDAQARERERLRREAEDSARQLRELELAGAREDALAAPSAKSLRQRAIKAYQERPTVDDIAGNASLMVKTVLDLEWPESLWEVDPGSRNAWTWLAPSAAVAEGVGERLAYFGAMGEDGDDVLMIEVYRLNGDFKMVARRQVRHLYDLGHVIEVDAPAFGVLDPGSMTRDYEYERQARGEAVT